MKPTLLLLPGLGADEALFRRQIDHLTDIVNPVCVDYRNCATRAEMAEAALRATPGTFAVAGMSLGGWVAQEVVHLAPRRVLKLALLNTWARPQAPEFCRGWHQTIARVEAGQYEQVLQEYLPNLFHPSRLTDTELISDFLAMCRRVGPAVYLRQLQAMVALDATMVCRTYIVSVARLPSSTAVRMEPFLLQNMKRSPARFPGPSSPS
jgi:pimeloyl-ACP methyl ester carboxylesterase